MEVATVMRNLHEAKGGKLENLFDTVTRGGDVVTKDDVTEFLTKGEAKVPEELVDRVYGSKEKKEENGVLPALTRDEFNRTNRVYYKVIKEIVLSDNLLIEQSGQLRRMGVGEVMQVKAGPCLDPSIGVYRLQGHALKDGITGWATIAGNQGITFLTAGGTIFKVSAATPLTTELKDLTGEDSVRMLVEGEILEVVDWARTSRSALGVTRVRAKACKDGAEGWATVDNNEGAVFLEVA